MYSVGVQTGRRETWIACQRRCILNRQYSTGRNNGLSTSALRQAFLSYFQQNGHVILPSDTLVPTSDPTLLFTNAGEALLLFFGFMDLMLYDIGMVQFKDYFSGTKKVELGKEKYCFYACFPFVSYSIFFALDF